MKLKPSHLFLVFIIIVMGIFFGTSLTYDEMGVKFMPALMSGITIILCVVALVQDFMAGGKEAAPTDEEGDVIEDKALLRTPLSAYFKALLWFFALIVGVYFCGIAIAVPIWVIVYLLKKGFTPVASITTGVALTVAYYAIFTLGLKIQLYQGLFADLLSRAA